MLRKPHQIRQELDEVRQEADSLLTKAQAEERDLTADERNFVDTAFSKIEKLNSDLDLSIKTMRIQSDELKAKHGRPVYSKDNPFDVKWVRDGYTGGQVFRDSTGREIRAYASNQKLSENVDSANLVGELVQASIIGLKSWHHEEVRATMGASSNATGGFLLTPAMWNGLIDLARAKSRLIEAGCSTVPMETSELLIAAVASDPSFEEKAENAKFTGTTVTLKQISLQSRTIGNVVTMSRELAADAPNAAPLIGDVLARSLAAAIDTRALTGNSSANFNGLLNRSDIDTTGSTSIGAIEWADLHTAATAVRVRNHEPTASIMHPKAYGALVTSFGTDTWTDAPPSLQGVAMLPTTGCSEAKAIVGDFRYALFGIRQQPLLEISYDAGEAFERHQLKLKLTWRGDFGVTDSSAFHRLEGLTY